MSEQNNEQMPEPDRYSVEYVELDGEGDTSVTLQNVLNEGSRKSQRLIGVATDPMGKGVLLFWDLEGFISG
ncbi:MAG: hypothetical protein M3N10_02325 [Actinomycetota bacterium]|nr:hypothetical protein [Actinomycetota bacterium]HZY66267.1 hypothetical protein [Rubrobacteraceae bacterium]